MLDRKCRERLFAEPRSEGPAVAEGEVDQGAEDDGCGNGGDGGKVCALDKEGHEGEGAAE